jgi:methylation protein EvaC
MKCKFSGKIIRPFMSFGKMPMANGFLSKNDFKKEFFYNLEVGFSKDIFLFQVNDHPKSQKIFNNKYPFILINQNL